MPVSDPPVLQSLFLESPWPVVITLMGVAAVLWVLATRRRERRLTIAAAVVVVMAVGAYALAAAVKTDREHLLDRTRQIVAATAPLDLLLMDGLIEPGASLSGDDGAVWMRYDQVRTELEGIVQRFGIERQQVRSLAAEVRDGGGARTLFELRTTLGQGIGPRSSVWQLIWAKDAEEQWRVQGIQWLKFEGQPPMYPMWR